IKLSRMKGWPRNRPAMLRSVRRPRSRDNLARSPIDRPAMDTRTPLQTNCGVPPAPSSPLSHIAKAETAANRLSPVGSHDSGRVEAVEPAHPGLGVVGPIAGQGAEAAVGRQQLGMAGDLVGSDRVMAQAGIAAEQGGDLILALLGLQRAGAIHQGAARFEQRNGVVEKTALQRSEER